MPLDDDAQLHDDLLATSESVEADARRVVEIEEAKQLLAAGDPMLAPLSQEAEVLAREIQAKSRIERDLSEASLGSAHRPPRPS